MSKIDVTEYMDVRMHAEEQGLYLKSELVILPRGFGATASDGSLAHEAAASTVQKLLRGAGLDVQVLQRADEKPPSIIERSSAWVAPTIFVGSMLFSENPSAVQVALNVISSYITDLLKARGQPDAVKLNIIVEDTNKKRCRRVEYEGPADKLKDLAEVLTALHNDRQ